MEAPLGGGDGPHQQSRVGTALGTPGRPQPRDGDSGPAGVPVRAGQAGGTGHPPKAVKHVRCEATTISISVHKAGNTDKMARKEDQSEMKKNKVSESAICLSPGAGEEGGRGSSWGAKPTPGWGTRPWSSLGHPQASLGSGSPEDQERLLCPKPPRTPPICSLTLTSPRPQEPSRCPPIQEAVSLPLSAPPTQEGATACRGKVTCHPHASLGCDLGGRGRGPCPYKNVGLCAVPGINFDDYKAEMTTRHSGSAGPSAGTAANFITGRSFKTPWGTQTNNTLSIAERRTSLPELRSHEHFAGHGDTCKIYPHRD